MHSEDEVPSRAPSIRDVARVAGVSSQTVSRVANGAGTVRRGTRETVLAAMRTLGYSPNPVARALRAGRRGVLAIALPAAVGSQERQTLASIVIAAAELGYAVLPVRENETAATGADIRLLDFSGVDPAGRDAGTRLARLLDAAAH